MHLSAQVVSRGRVPQQELVVPAREGLALMAELLSQFLASRRAIILVVLSRLWGGGVADRGTDKGADFLARNIIIE